jgi:hypothetical protein
VPNLNQPCNTAIAAACVVWGIEQNAGNRLLNLPLNPGETRTLTLSNAFFGPKGSSSPPYPPNVDVYALVDSVDFSTTHGAVLESREDNNLFGPVKSTAGSVTNTELIGTSMSSPGDDLPSRE